MHLFLLKFGIRRWAKKIRKKIEIRRQNEEFLRQNWGVINNLISTKKKLGIKLKKNHGNNQAILDTLENTLESNINVSLRDKRRLERAQTTVMESLPKGYRFSDEQIEVMEVAINKSLQNTGII